MVCAAASLRLGKKRRRELRRLHWPSNLAIFCLPVIARAMRHTWSEDSVPLLVKRTFSTEGTREASSAVISASSELAWPKASPSSRLARTASITVGGVWPRIVVVW